MRLTWLFLLATVVAEPASARGALVFRFGYFLPSGGGAAWERNGTLFDLEARDFNYFVGGIEFGLELSPFVDFTLGIDGYSRLVRAPYRDLVRQDGSDIVRSFKLRVVPITAGVRLFPIGKRRRFVPYISAGGTVYNVNYQETGDAVDPESFRVSPREIGSRALAGGGYAGAGIEVRTLDGLEPGRGWYTFVELRAFAANPRTSSIVTVEGTGLALGVAILF